MKNMVKGMFGLVLAVLLMTAISPAMSEQSSAPQIIDSGTFGETITWTLDEDGLLTISGSGPMEDLNYYPGPFRSKGVKKIKIEDGITHIGAHMFDSCGLLTEVIIPDSVTSIGGGAFARCSALKSFSIPENVTSIAGAFFDCNQLERFYVADNNASYSTIDGVLFNKDKSEIVQYPAGKTDSIYEIPNGVVTIQGSAFSGCLNVSSIIIPDTVTTISHGAFSNCEQLISASISKNVAYIGQNVFEECYRLQEIQVDPLNENYCSVDGVMFNKSMSTILYYPANRGVSHYTIPVTVTSIPSGAFNYADIEYIDIPESVTYIEGWAFQGAHFKELSWPGNVSCIESSTFRYCTELTTINIPDTVISIEREAFHGCTNLAEITLPNNINCIETYTFLGCGSLTSITIPSKVRSIGYGAFEDCADLVLVSVLGNVNEIDETAFNRCSSELTLTVRPNSYAQQFAIDHQIQYVLSDAAPAIIASGTCGETITWTLDEDGLLNISGSGPMEDYDYGSTPWNEYENTINSVVIASGVTSIGAFSFASCSNIVSVEMADSVENINSYAFQYCWKIDDILLPDHLTQIGYRAFYGCSDLTSFMIPANVTNISGGAFAGCNLAEILVDVENPYYVSVDGVLFTKNMLSLVQYPMKKSGDFYQIPNGVLFIESRAFEGCALVQVEIPNTVTDIGFMAFTFCNNLTEITLPENIVNIGPYGIDWCENLSSLYILGYETHFEENAIDRCEKMTMYGYAGSTAQEYANEYGMPFSALPGMKGFSASYNDSAKTVHVDCMILDNSEWCIVIDGGDTGIILTRLSRTADIEQKLTAGIHSVRLEDRSNLRSYSITLYIQDTQETMDTPDYCLPENTKEIGEEAFAGVPASVVKLPDSVTAIGKRAFAGCPNLRQIYIPADIQTIAPDAFDGAQDLVIFGTPDTAAEDYAAQHEGVRFVEAAK